MGFNGDHYERAMRAFAEYAYSKQMLSSPDAELDIIDHISAVAIPVATVANPTKVDFLADSDNPLVLTESPQLIKKQQQEKDVLIGVYAIGLCVNLGPSIADAEIADMQRICEVMGQAKVRCLDARDRKRWDLVGSRILTSRPGQVPASSNGTTVTLTRGPVQRGPELTPFPSVRIFNPGDKAREHIEYDGSLWATAPAVAANFNVERILHCFVARGQ